MKANAANIRAARYKARESSVRGSVSGLYANRIGYQGASKARMAYIGPRLATFSSVTAVVVVNK